MRPAVLVLSVALATWTPEGRRHFAAAPAQAPSPDTPCGSGGTAPRPSRDLYCIELAAIPALEGVAATFELDRIPSPFGTDVTKDGRQVYAAVLRAAGLPAPDAFSPGARVWIAWMTTQQFSETRRLGVVGNGTFSLPEVDWPKFLILVTAEASADAREPDGRVALRGFSARPLMPPPDMAQFLYGAAPERNWD